jgi:hypothetical protein
VNILLDAQALTNFEDDFYLQEHHQSLHMDAIKLLFFSRFTKPSFTQSDWAEKHVLN